MAKFTTATRAEVDTVEETTQQRRLEGLAKARAARAAKRAEAMAIAMDALSAQEEAPMHTPNGPVMSPTAEVAEPVEITPIPPFPTPDEVDLVPSVDIPLQPHTPAQFVAAPPPAIQFVPSVGLLTKFFPGYQPRGVYYNVGLKLRDRIMGGTPSDPNVMEGWLRKLGLGTEKADEIRAIAIQTVRDLGGDLSEDPTWEEVEEVSKSIAANKQTNMFRRDPRIGCYVEDRTIKAMLKENCNIVFAKDRWGATKKGAKAYLAERVFVDPPMIALENGRPDIHKPDGVHLFIGHVQGPQGRQSTLTYYEYVLAPVLRFQIRVFEDCITPQQWGPIWESAQENGQGSLRSQSFGRFDLIEWDGPHAVKGA